MDPEGRVFLLYQEAGTGRQRGYFYRCDCTIPMDESYQDKKLGITIVADAVQAANFAPDFRAMSPWGNQKILRCIHDTDGLVVQKKSPVDLKVEFEGNAHKLIAAPEDFSGFSTAMREMFFMIL